MSNTLTPLSPTYWSKRMGNKRYKKNVFRSFASFEEQASLTDGQKVDRPYRANVVVENYTKGTALTAQDLASTSDQLTVDTTKALLMYVDNVDKIQNKYSAAEAWIKEAMERLNNAIDARFFYEVVNAADTIDDGDIGGTAGNGITATTSNILSIFSAINMKADANNLPMEGRKLAISPQFKRKLIEYTQGKQSLLGDKTTETGNIGEFSGILLYLTNNLTGSAVWVPANQPTNGDTITINGITINLVTSLGSTANNVLVETDTATTIDNIVAFINSGGAGVTNKSVAASTANQRIMQDWVAVDGTTYFTVYAKGASYMTVSGSDATDVWTSAKQLQHLLFSMDKAIDAVIQKAPSVEMASTVSAGKAGMNILPMTLFGVYTFNQGRNEIFDVQIRSDAY